MTGKHIKVRHSRNGRLRASENSIYNNNEKTGKNGQNQPFQKCGNSPKACNNLGSIYSRKAAAFW